MYEMMIRHSDLGAFPVNNTLAGIVPMASPVEQAVLTEHIKENGQKEPVVLWRGEIVDGRCRQAALVSLGRHIMYRELDDTLDEDAVKVFVKAVNTRRNLTLPQKIMSACKEYIANRSTVTVKKTAMSWGIGEVTLKNALWVYKQDPGIIETLFNGGVVVIKDEKGRLIESNKITAIYSYLKKEQENVVMSVDKGWVEGSSIKSQAGKEWYYRQIELVGNVPYVKMLIAELANHKFPLPEVVDAE